MKNRIHSKCAALCAAGLLLTLCAASCSANSGKTAMDAYRKESVAYQALQGEGSKKPEPAEIEGKKLAQENAYLALYYQEETAAIAVFDKRSGAWWHSNPSGPKGLSAAASSQLNISTISSQGIVQQYTSYTDSLSKGQVEYTCGPDGLMVRYVFGVVKPDLSTVPEKLTDERFKELQQRAKEAGAQDSLLTRRYKKEGDVWIRKDVTNDQAEKLRNMFEAIGYTAEELAADNAAAGASSAAQESGGFEIPMQYTLEGDSLLVRIDGEAIRYPSNELITSMSVLEYFGALSQNAEGYLFIPDGSGALMNTKPQKGNAGLYMQPVYGLDHTLSREVRNDQCYDILLPVFGVSRPDAGMLGIIEDNEAAASVRAVKPGYVDGYATINAAFELNAAENIGLSSDAISKFYVTAENRYQGDTLLRYVFLEQANASYSGMARVYREYLDLSGKRQRLERTGDIPFFLETIGAVETETSTLGFVHEAYAALTTYEDNIAFVEDLKSRGVGNIQLLLSGWMNGGTDQKLADRLDLMGELGGTKGFQKLQAYTKEQNVGLYPLVYLNTFSNRTSQSIKNQYTSKTLGSKKSSIGENNFLMNAVIPGETAGQRYILSPAWQLPVAKKYLSALNKKGIQSAALGDIAHTSYSDYNKKSEALRQNAVLQSKEIVALFAGELSGLMLSAPNQVNAALGTTFVDVPKSSSSYSLSSESVPFYQMVYHGYADYAFTNMNFDTDLQKSVLKCAEYGGYPKFRFARRENAQLDITETAELYAAMYTGWIDEAAAAYASLNELLAPVRNAVMTGHTRLAAGVYRTSYDNGMHIYVNYTDKTVSADGVTIEAQSAVRKEGHAG